MLPDIARRDRAAPGRDGYEKLALAFRQSFRRSLFELPANEIIM